MHEISPPALPILIIRRMDEQLQIAAENGDVDALYTRLAQDPYLPDRIDRIPIVDIPLPFCHGMHSDSERINHYRQSTYPSQSKGDDYTFTLLAQIDDADLLAELLSACPSSVEDITIHCETAVHIAVKNCSIRDFEVVKLLIKNDSVNVKNFNGLTAMDIFHLQGTMQNVEIVLVVAILIATATYQARLSLLAGTGKMTTIHQQTMEPTTATRALGKGEDITVQGR
ncbi:Uncharacterized protein TCM_015860 [Theobroma cacao]|uniref:Ankyrin repeat family protein n=1 Tax=Theobroma cacao TaxID=3641 RepID=A0A061GB02_THECC|nr:Uncharacterized protein TCM_015860 [Theobroma cacao]